LLLLQSIPGLFSWAPVDRFSTGSGAALLGLAWSSYAAGRQPTKRSRRAAGDGRYFLRAVQPGFAAAFVDCLLSTIVWLLFAVLLVFAVTW